MWSGYVHLDVVAKGSMEAPGRNRSESARSTSRSRNETSEVATWSFYKFTAVAGVVVSLIWMSLLKCLWKLPVGTVLNTLFQHTFHDF